MQIRNQILYRTFQHKEPIGMLQEGKITMSIVSM